MKLKNKPQLDGSHRLDVAIWLAPYSVPKCCYTCDEYNAKTGICSQFDSAPPVSFKEIGCEKWLLKLPF